MDLPSSWDTLRKQARKLEAQLDEQMNSYRKFVASKADGTESDVESGIDRLIKQLQLVISQMQSWVSVGGSEVFSHTVTRHQEILQDLTQEFHRLRSSLRAKQEHASLLEDFMEFDRSRVDLEEGGASADQALLKEHASISRNTGQMDNVISHAQATLGTLVFQRSTFGGINSKDKQRQQSITNGKPFVVSDKEEKINGYNHTISCCFRVYLSYSYYWLSK